MDLSQARRVMAEFAESSRNFSLSGPPGYEDLVAVSPETETRYFRQIEMTEHGQGNFGFLLYVYSQELDNATRLSSKFEKLIAKSAKNYEKQNVKLAKDGKKFFLGVALLDDSTDLLRLLATFSKLALGVQLFEQLLNKKLRLNLPSKT